MKHENDFYNKEKEFQFEETPETPKEAEKIVKKPTVLEEIIKNHLFVISKQAIKEKLDELISTEKPRQKHCCSKVKPQKYSYVSSLKAANDAI